MNKIYLIGMPGSGKTTLGKKLAHNLGLAFLDLDAEIERKEGMPISALFDTKGEDYFRQAESAALRTHGSSPHAFVMATGGGTPCFLENMTFIKNSGTAIFLDVPVDELIKRMDAGNVSKRPLLGKSQNLLARLTAMRESRMPCYSQAHITVTGDRVGIDAIQQALEGGYIK